MLHRFLDKDRAIQGIAPEDLRCGLDYLRRHRYELLSLTELIARLAEHGPAIRGAVVFTIDDGYQEQADVAAPIFTEFDCPVTTFVTTGFLDGKLWFWWDKIEYIFKHTRRQSVKVRLGGTAVSYQLGSETGAGSLWEELFDRCKGVEDEEKHSAITRLAEEADVELPNEPPLMYKPMTWDQVRTCEEKGMMFGPHTVTHPILSHTRSDRVEWEITESWNRLRAEVRKPAPVFCYPNGQWQDFGTREIEILRKASFQGAVVGELGFADPKSFRQSADGAFKIKRISFPENRSDFIQYVCGIERIKQILRGET